MFAVMNKVDDETLQPTGINFNQECKYIPLFPEVKDALAWIQDAGFPWHCIAECGISYEDGCIVHHNPDNGVEQAQVEVVND